MASAGIDYKELDSLLNLVKQAGDPEKGINEVLHGTGGDLISKNIAHLLPRSGRTWRGKAKAAADAQPFTKENGNLCVTVKTRGAYHYLYFPDDGSNTKRHAGGLHFMERGAESSKEKIIDEITTKLIAQIEGA